MYNHFFCCSNSNFYNAYIYFRSSLVNSPRSKSKSISSFVNTPIDEEGNGFGNAVCYFYIY